MVAETFSEYGSDSTYSLVVRRPLSVATIHFRGFSLSPVAHVCLPHRVASFSGGGQRLGSVAVTTHKRWGMHALIESMNFLAIRM